jgi:hypothetical protein
MGFQAELEWNSNADFIDLKSDIIKLENVNREKNTLKISWNGKIDQPKIASLFFRKYPEELKLKNNFLQSEAYTIDLKAVPLSFTSKNLNNKKIQFGPNPWTDQHMFIFDVNQKEEVTLEIMDGNGKILFRKNKPMMEGKHEWTVFQDEILGSGIFYFRLYSKSFSHSGKMLKL